MSSYAHPAPERPSLGGGFAGALLLHAGVVALLIAIALLHPLHNKHWGEDSAAVGSIQASMVNAIPLPPKAVPVDKSVLASEDVTKAPEPQPKERTAPPPSPNDILVKEKTLPTPPKVAPRDVTPPKHPQPVAPSPKATSGDAATQLPQAISQTANGTATLTVENRTFGNRYAYYLRLVGSRVTQSYNQQFPDPRTSQNKSVTLLFDIERDGTVANLRTEIASGSPSLDSAAKRAVLEIDSFGQLPEGDHITIEYKFDYKHP